MPRTPDDIAFTDRIAAGCGYVAPPSELEPIGPIREDDTWEALAQWFTDHGIHWCDGIEVYISRRWDVSIAEVYADIDGWKAGRLRRLDIEADPEATNLYGN